MSSFRRRVTTIPIPGSRPSPYNSLPLLSTGLSSLDDILGGGLPLSSSLLLESDTPTSYADLLLKFFIAQGLECKQDVVVVSSGLEGGPEELVKTLMGVEGGSSGVESEEEDEGEKAAGEKLKIAFRYEGMKQHAVTIPAPAPPKAQDSDVYCSMFDLTGNKPLRAADRARLHLIDVNELQDPTALPVDLYDLLYQRLSELISSGGYALPQDPTKPRKALRIALSSFGSPSWGPSSSSSLYLFLHRLRSLLRRSSASATLTFPAHFYRTSSPSLLTRLEHACDGVIELESFAASPLSLLAYPRHNGLLRIPKLPSLGSLLPPSAKLSVLRGLGGGEGGMENNVGFRVKRRRFVIETVNGDGPVGGNEGKKVEEKVVEKKVEEPVRASTKVRFAGEEEKVVPKPKNKSVSATIHKQPELYEF